VLDGCKLAGRERRSVAYSGDACEARPAGRFAPALLLLAAVACGGRASANLDTGSGSTAATAGTANRLGRARAQTGTGANLSES
jgi:hypothetical protein